VGGTTGGDATAPDPARSDAGATAPAAPDEALGSLSDGDLPTRMLVFGVARHDGSVAAADAFAVAEACVRSPEQVRSCLRRLVAEGLFERQGTGQRATYLPTDAGLRALSTMGIRAVQARQQDLERRDWDGRWHLVAFAIPEARRAARDALRERLGGLGGAAVHNGLYVSPHDWGKDVTSVASELGVAEHVTQAATDRLIVGGESEPRALARRLWRLDDLASRYEAFVARWSNVLDGLATMQRQHEALPDTAFLPGALAMAIAYGTCFDADPLLPAELLPRPWPGRTARDLLADSRRIALQIRAESGRPALFATYHDLVDSVPTGPDAEGDDS
jgi:phenylacetic acid degradation operon negative regulatory protein